VCRIGKSRDKPPIGLRAHGGCADWNRATSDVAMANDPLPLPDISAQPPPDNTQGADDLHDAHGSDDAQDAEYDAIHAEIAATERGRWFLSEYAKRNRAADTDRLVSSLVRAEAAMRGGEAVEAGGPDESLAVEPAPSVSATGEPAVAEPVEPPVTQAAPAASPGSVTPSMWEAAAVASDLAGEVPANDENTGVIEPAEDGIGPSATDRSETTWSADDDIGSLLDAETAAPLPSTTQSRAGREDLDELFEPLPPEPDVKRAAVNAVQREPQQMLSPELRAPAFPGSAVQIGASPAEPPALLVTSAPAARTIRRPPPNDPLAAVRALSEEELIALFS
jgi:hypothetical protein